MQIEQPSKRTKTNEGRTSALKANAPNEGRTPKTQVSANVNANTNEHSGEAPLIHRQFRDYSNMPSKDLFRESYEVQKQIFLNMGAPERRRISKLEEVIKEVQKDVSEGVDYEVFQKVDILSAKNEGNIRKLFAHIKGQKDEIEQLKAQNRRLEEAMKRHSKQIELMYDQVFKSKQSDGSEDEELEVVENENGEVEEVVEENEEANGDN